MALQMRRMYPRAQGISLVNGIYEGTHPCCLPNRKGDKNFVKVQVLEGDLLMWKAVSLDMATSKENFLITAVPLGFM